MEWTFEQQSVIETRGSNLLVSAAAGSGKTAVLVERIIRRITDEKNPVSIDRLLVMTFTKAAAGEMRERIAAALRERIKQDKDNKYLKLQAALLPRAKISTIDSICNNLIKQNYQELRIDPAFRVAEEGELKLIKNDIIKEILEEKYREKDESFTGLLEIVSGGRSDSELYDLILKIYNFISSYPFYEMFFKEVSAETEKESEGKLSELPWIKYMLSDIEEGLCEYEELLGLCEELCAEEEGLSKYSENIREAKEILLSLKEAKGYGELRAAAERAEFSRLATVRSGTADEELKEAVKKTRNDFKDWVKALKEDYLSLPYDVLIESVKRTAPYIDSLMELSRRFMESFEDEKTKRNIVDFSDLEHLALRLLWRFDENGELCTTELSDRLSGEFDEILIDEYQDSNMVQEYLIKALSSERFGKPNVFMVGDVKQSIYRFRLARPEIFMEKYESYAGLKEDSAYESGLFKGAEERDGKAPSSGPEDIKALNLKIELNKNFRSRSSVLSAVNSIFLRLMRHELGGVEYNEDTSLKLGAKYPSESEEINKENGFSSRAELIIIEKNAPEEETGGEEISELSSRELEARLIAEKISELMSLHDRERAFRVYDRRLNALRPVEYRDIVILMRSPAGGADKLVNILSFAGIPAYAETVTGYFSAPEVEIMLSLLNIVDNPIQDIPLTAVLKSPVGRFSNEELAFLRSEFMNSEEAAKGARSMYAALLYAASMYDIGSANEEDGGRGFFEERAVPSYYKKARDFLLLLNSLRDYADFHSVSELITEIYKRTGFYDYASAMPLGNIRRANLNMLLERAESYSKTSFKGLFNFVRYIEQLKRYDTDYGEAPVYSEEDDIVRITSIHKSKGLEYPVVILAGLDKAFNKNDMREKLCLDPELGIGIDYVDIKDRVRYPSLKKAVIKKKLGYDSYGEELRVLYVAMTRAKEKLIMTAALKDAEKKLSKKSPALSVLRAGASQEKLLKSELIGAGSFLDWILLGRYGNEEALELKVVSSAELYSEEVQKASKKSDRLSLYSDISKEEVFCEELERELIKNLSFSYTYKEATGLYPKKSVSEIKHEHIEADFDDNASEENGFADIELAELCERLQEGRQVYAGALRGTAYHRVFELLDYREDCDIENIGEQLKNMAASGKLSEDKLSYIEAETVAGLCKSDIGEMMKRAERGEKGRLYRERHFMIGRPARELTEGSSSDELQLLQGIIDAYIEYDGEIVLIDYKTDRIRNREKGGEELKEKYAVQLELYAKALEQLTGKRVTKKLIYSTELKRSVEL